MAELEQPPVRKFTAVKLIELTVVALLVVAFVTVSVMRQWPAGVTAGKGLGEWWKSNSRALGIVIAAGLTMIMFSFLYRDNALFKIGEHLYVGVSLGWSAVVTWREALRPEVYEPFFQSPSTDALVYTLIHRSLPVLLGILLLTRLSRKYGWLSRYSYATMIGWGSGLGIAVVTNTFILKQLHAAITPFLPANIPSADLFSKAWFTGIALPFAAAATVMIGTVAVLWYFFFSVEHKGAGKKVSQLGVLFLMVSFGASFGYTVMGRISLLIGRVQFMLIDWLKLPK
jgi:hypothetical protein